ncbi:MAG: fibrillarin-like rRNA/tRNA 2'-O-methyltransferase [Theionarchaea archaeon]|nr:fibrillarin-like rRNA/tRNA 2'-O-methyltransferase [Theionarchaea archaeon]MBU7021830.1 fibrillarin-like rRNA/tRNA 2'-O-methyltransferase [Theionarchaea archaeon]MBU7040003.1 fibrillarin-like rRNA/tRNA 2'-O-methyltransferase [Theionarchaea archaeon]
MTQVSHTTNPRVFYMLQGRKKVLLTQDASPEYSVYGEQKVEADSHIFRTWDPYRSKLASSILEGLPSIPIREEDTVLYLGAANGTTASHISDIVGSSGVVYCVEFSPVPFGDLIRLAEHRTNIFPILADARDPVQYSFMVGGVDVLYCDLAQPSQCEIVLSNAARFLRSGGHLLQAIKASSIDSSLPPSQVYETAVSELSRGFAIRSTIPLDRYQKKHIMVWGVYAP